MPATRRSAGASHSRTAAPKGQSRISFANKVTKKVPKDGKKGIAAPSLAQIEIAERTKPSEAPEEEKAKVEDETDEQQEEEETEQEAVMTKSEAEVRAEKLSDAQIGKYWKAIEKERKAPRVHQQELTVNDKVLRYFDVSSQYGPCIGIDRTKRWQRAERLGLSPPIEVLSVLLKEHRKTNEGVETAQMDHILSSIAIGS